MSAIPFLPRESEFIPTVLPENYVLHPSFSGDFRIFCFQKPEGTPSLKVHKVHQILIDEKPVVTIDQFFAEEEENQWHQWVNTASFTQKIFFSRESMADVCMMDQLSHLALLETPFPSLNRLYQLLGQIGAELNADVLLQPLQLNNHVSKERSHSIVTNVLREVPSASSEEGWHKDYQPEEIGLPFLIPRVDTTVLFPPRFANGSFGNPYLISLILYVANKHFTPLWGLGTSMRDSQRHLTTIECRSMRIVLFQGDIEHTIQASSDLCPKEALWKRLSLVMKLILRPKDSYSAIPLKDRFIELFAQKF